MRLLLTGFTTRQCGLESDQSLKYATIFAALPEALRAAGYEVTQREVTPGENLRDQFDVALIGLHAMASMASSRKYGAVWTATRLPYAVMFEDWKVKTVVDHMKTTNYLWKSSHLDGYMLEMFRAASPHSNLMDRVRARWSRTLDRGILPMFGWGDPGVITELAPEMTRCAAWDLSPWLPTFAEPTPMTEKAPAWVLASFSDQDEWLERLDPPLRWPVHRIFKSVRDGRLISRTYFVDEPTLVREYYGKSYAMFMPYYGKECLEGWWRSRPQFAAQAGCVLCGHPRDARKFGDGYCVPHGEIESMSVDQLQALASHQAALTRRWILSKPESARALRAAIEAATVDPVRPSGG